MVPYKRRSAPSSLTALLIEGFLSFLLYLVFALITQDGREDSGREDSLEEWEMGSGKESHSTAGSYRQEWPGQGRGQGQGQGLGRGPDRPPLQTFATRSEEYLLMQNGRMAVSPSPRIAQRTLPKTSVASIHGVKLLQKVPSKESIV